MGVGVRLVIGGEGWSLRRVWMDNGWKMDRGWMGY